MHAQSQIARLQVEVQRQYVSILELDRVSFEPILAVLFGLALSSSLPLLVAYLCRETVVVIRPNVSCKRHYGGS